MQAVSSKFLAALRTSHQLWVTAQALGPGWSTRLSLPVAGGTVTLDRTADVRGRVELTINDPSYFPRVATDPLAPYGSELYVARGIRYPDGTVETVPLGVYRIEQVALDAATGEVHLSGRDRMSQVADERFAAPYAPKANTRHIDVISALIRGVYPRVPLHLQPIATMVGAPVFEEDRLGAVQALAAAIGCQAYFGPTGDFWLTSIPAPTASTYVWQADASATGVLTGGSKELTRDQVYNGVVARGEDASSGRTPVSSLVYDAAAYSPTRWGGPFGHVPRFYQSSLITTTAQAASAAASLLNQSKNLNVSVNASAVPNPALVPGDAVQVTWKDGKTAIYLIDTLTIPLSVGDDMTMTARAAITAGGLLRMDDVWLLEEADAVA